MRNAGIIKLKGLSKLAYFALVEMRRGNLNNANMRIREFEALRKEIEKMHPKLKKIVRNIELKEGMPSKDAEAAQKKHFTDQA